MGSYYRREKFNLDSFLSIRQFRYGGAKFTSDVKPPFPFVLLLTLLSGKGDVMGDKRMKSPSVSMPGSKNLIATDWIVAIHRTAGKAGAVSKEFFFPPIFPHD